MLCFFFLCSVADGFVTPFIILMKAVKCSQNIGSPCSETSGVLICGGCIIMLFNYYYFINTALFVHYKVTVTYSCPKLLLIFFTDFFFCFSYRHGKWQTTQY